MAVLPLDLWLYLTEEHVGLTKVMHNLQCLHFILYPCKHIFPLTLVNHKSKTHFKKKYPCKVFYSLQVGEVVHDLNMMSESTVTSKTLLVSHGIFGS